MTRNELVEYLLGLDPETRRSELAGLSDDQRQSVAHALAAPGRTPGQLAPEDAWHTWMIMAGRGYGKTRAGAEWVRAVAERDPDRADRAGRATTLGEARRVMVEGPSGLLAIAPTDAAPGVRAVEAAADLAQGRGGDAVLGRRARELARAAAQPRVVRRDRQVGPGRRAGRSGVGQPAARPAARPRAASGGDDHAARGHAGPAAARPGRRGADPRDHEGQQGQPAAGVRTFGASAIRPLAARPAGTRRRADRRDRRRAVDARRCSRTAARRRRVRRRGGW